MAEMLKPNFAEVWASGGSVIEPSVAKIKQGWIEEQPPSQFENYLQRRQDEAIKYLFQRGIASWDKDEEYFSARSVVIQGGKLYISKTNNKNKNPTTSTEDWRDLFALGIADITGLTAELALKADKTETAALTSGKADKVIKVTAGNGLTGGGTLAADITLTLGTPTAITSSSSNTVTATGHTHSVSKASTTTAGVVQLVNTFDSDSTTMALTAAAGKELYAIAKTGGDGALLKELNLSDLPNKATARSNLQLGSAAIKNIGTNSGDVLAVGEFGYGDDTTNINIRVPNGTNLNDLTTTGNWRLPTSSGIGGWEENNYPVPKTGSLSVTLSYYGVRQDFTTFDSTAMYTRWQVGTGSTRSWNAWRKVYSSMDFDPDSFQTKLAFVGGTSTSPVMREGAHGIGAYVGYTSAVQDEIPLGLSFGGDTASATSSFGRAGAMLRMGAWSAHSVQLHFDIADKVRFRRRSATGWGEINEFWTNLNFNPSDKLDSTTFNTRTVNAGTGLKGGGALSANITISADFGTGSSQIARGNHLHSQYWDIVNPTGYAPSKSMDDMVAGEGGFTRKGSDWTPDVPVSGMDLVTKAQYGSGDLLQILFPQRDVNRFMMRTRGSNSPVGWRPWMEFWHDQNFDPNTKQDTLTFVGDSAGGVMREGAYGLGGNSLKTIGSANSWAESSNENICRFITTSSSGSFVVDGTTIPAYMCGIRLSRNGSGHGVKILADNDRLIFGRNGARSVWHNGNFDPNTKFNISNIDTTVTTSTISVPSSKAVSDALTPKLDTTAFNARTITAGNGLSGGGSLAANRTIALGTPTAVGTSSINTVTASSHTHALDAAVKTSLTKADNSVQKGTTVTVQYQGNIVEFGGVRTSGDSDPQTQWISDMDSGFVMIGVRTGHNTGSDFYELYPRGIKLEVKL